LCHGVFGNLESLLVARERVGYDDAQFVDSIVEHALSSYGTLGKPWPTGVIGGIHDPSLMVGEAGIGLFLLRFANPAVPSVLCISDWGSPDSRLSASSNLESHLRLAEVEHLLPIAGPAARRLAPDSVSWRTVRAMAAGGNEVAEIVTAFRTEISSDVSPTGAMLRDALSVDALALDEIGAFDNYARQVCIEGMRPSADEVSWSTARVALASNTRLIRTERTWSAWLKDPAGVPEKDEEAFAIFRRGAEVERLALSSLNATVLAMASEPSTLDEIIVAVLASLEFEPGMQADLAQHITAVLQEAFSAGIIEVV
jgi:hypothetical protein